MFDHIEVFHRPATAHEAVLLLQENGPAGRYVAGGTDLIVQGDRSIRALIDVTRMGLDYIEPRGDECVIGATATMNAIARAPLVREWAGGILARAAATCGSVQIRNMATLGGSLANGSPAADLATPLLAMEARVGLEDSAGRRSVPLTEFYAGERARGALLIEAAIPPPPQAGRAGWSFQKLGRTCCDISLVNVAAGLGLDGDGRVLWARLALGAVAPVPMRAAGAEGLLLGRTLTPELLGEAAETVAREVRPIDDVRASADYRREMAGVFTRRALRECAREAGCA
ncbi:MAG: xanthine dehydrogenase family protein subunit M [Acidobacteria bacterium]|nr:xanthine dehydrogenase family protein subunit M [Acidobacteriota bacterium]